MIKKILTNYRYYILAVLGIVSTFCLFADVSDNCTATAWALRFIGSKLLGVILLLACNRLFGAWERNGDIPELSKLVGED